MKKPKRKKKPRTYTLRDLREMVNQLGGRLHLEIVPAELAEALDAARRAQAKAKEAEDLAEFP